MKQFAYEAPEYQLSRKPGGNHLRGAQIKSGKDAATYLRQLYGDDVDIYESAFMIMLNRANNVIGNYKLSQGGITGTVIDPRMVCKAAIDTLCTSVMICHNHPSGNLQPSRADEELTQKIKSALVFMDIRLIDHIILTSDHFYSFADEGTL